MMLEIVSLLFVVIVLSTNLAGCATIPDLNASNLTPPAQITEIAVTRSVDPASSQTPLVIVSSAARSPTHTAGDATQAAVPNPLLTQTQTPQAHHSPESAHTSTPSGSSSILEEGDPAQIPCDQAAPANPMDITIPDGTVLNPGQPFTKMWRLVNTGTCPWTSDYALVWFSSERFDANPTIPLINDVQPGDSVDLVVDMHAPMEEGLYQSNWKIQNANGELFGIGPNGDAPFWVRITVIDPGTPTPDLTTTAVPETIFQKELELAPGDAVDLDTFQVTESANADLRYFLDQDFAYKLQGENGGLIGAFSSSAPIKEDCSPTSYTGDAVEISEESQGYACVVSSAGFTGRVRILQVTPEHKISLEILVWMIP